MGLYLTSINPTWGGDVAQLVERWTGTLLMQVWFPSAAWDFSLRVNFQCRLSYSVRTSLCAIACISICAHVKDPVVHVRIWWILETLKHPVCTVGSAAQLCHSLLSPREINQIPHERNWNGTVQSLSRSDRWGDMRDDSAQIFFPSFLLEAPVSCSGMGWDVHSVVLSIQHFLCWPQCHPSSEVPWRMVLERLSRHVTYPNHAGFCFSTTAGRGSCGPTRKLTLFRTQSLVLRSKLEMHRGLIRQLVSQAWILFSVS